MSELPTLTNGYSLIANEPDDTRYPTTDRNVSSSHLLAALFTQPLLETEKLMFHYLLQYEFAMFFHHKTTCMKPFTLAIQTSKPFFFLYLRVMKRVGHLRTGGELIYV